MRNTKANWEIYYAQRGSKRKIYTVLPWLWEGNEMSRKSAYPAETSMSLIYKPDHTTKLSTVALYVQFSGAALAQTARRLSVRWRTPPWCRAPW